MMPINPKAVCLFTLLLGLVPSKTKAQTDVSGNVTQKGYGMVKTNMSATHYTGWGNIKDGAAAKVSYEIVGNKFLTLTANARCVSVDVDFEEGDLSGGYHPDAININGSHFIEQIGFTSTFKTKVLEIPFMGMAMLNSEWDGGSFARVSGIAVGLLMLRSDRNTQFGLGPLVMINSNSKLPAFLMFMYRHRFNERWLINLYGGMFSCDYTPSKNTLLSIGADIDAKSFYFSPNDSTLPNRSRFTSASFCPTLKYRQRLAPNLYLDMAAGVALKISSRVNGATGTKEYLECKQKPAPFLQIGASYSL